MVASYIVKGRRPTDEMYLEAADRIEPSLLSPSELEAVQKELDPQQLRRGRPRKGAITGQIVGVRLANVSRQDVPIEFLNALSKRLKRLSPRFTEFDREVSFHKRYYRKQRDSIMGGLYREILDLLNGAPQIEHPILGTLDVPDREMARSQKALSMTGTLLHSFGFDPPSFLTMLNIISKRKSHAKT